MEYIQMTDVTYIPLRLRILDGGTMQDAAPKEREGFRLCRSLGGDPPFPSLGLLVWLRGMRNGLRTYHMPKPKVVLTDSCARLASIGLRRRL